MDELNSTSMNTMTPVESQPVATTEEAKPLLTMNLATGIAIGGLAIYGAFEATRHAIRGIKSTIKDFKAFRRQQQVPPQVQVQQQVQTPPQPEQVQPQPEQVQPQQQPETNNNQ